MKNGFLISASLVVLLASAGSTLAQRPATPATTPAPATSASANVVLPISKMAVIDTDAFLDPKSGIVRFNGTLAKLNGEFQKQKDELTQLQQRVQTLTDELTKLQQAPAGTPIDSRTIQAKSDQLDQLKKDVQRKGEDAQAAYTRRRQELFAPLQEEVGRALEAFARARGINVILDASQVPLIYAADSIDITAAFISEFNSKNPAAAATRPQ